jgi:hypothetical protein
LNVLYIRKNKRFAVRRMVALSAGKDLRNGLLVEVSLEGFRIGNIDTEGLAIGTPIDLRIHGFGTLNAEVRWIQPGIAGLHLVQALHIPELNELIRLCRARPDDVLAYGT